MHHINPFSTSSTERVCPIWITEAEAFDVEAPTDPPTLPDAAKLATAQTGGRTVITELGMVGSTPRRAADLTLAESASMQVYTTLPVFAGSKLKTAQAEFEKHPPQRLLAPGHVGEVGGVGGVVAVNTVTQVV